MVFLGLQILLPFMDQELLKFPKLSRGYFGLLQVRATGDWARQHGCGSRVAGGNKSRDIVRPLAAAEQPMDDG